MLIRNRRPELTHSLSVKQKQPRNVQAVIDDETDVKSIRQHCRRGVQPIIRRPAGKQG